MDNLFSSVFHLDHASLHISYTLDGSGLLSLQDPIVVFKDRISRIVLFADLIDHCGHSCRSFIGSRPKGGDDVVNKPAIDTREWI